MSGTNAEAKASWSTSVASSEPGSANSLKKRPTTIDIQTSQVDSSQAGPKTPTAQSSVDKRIGHRRVDEQTGQVTYKKKTTTELMTAIQLGIGQSVGSLTSKPERDVLMQDFSVTEEVSFPENGSKLTPAHRVGDFKFKTYAPIAFRYFRELFCIHTDDFLASLCIQPLCELSNPGASGSIFFKTSDDEFIIKTVEKKEADFLQKLLPGYYMNLNQNPRTLLPKFYGLYCYQQPGKNIRFVVMNNLLPSSVRMHEKYDLKGSTYKRKASKHELAKSSPTCKDLDFRERHPEGLLLEGDTYEALMKTIRRDCRVLESFKIMDYSQLLAVHNLDEAKRLRAGSVQEKASSPQIEQPSTSLGAEAAPGIITRGRSNKVRLAHFSTAMESIQAEIDPVELEDDDEDVPPGGIPARNAKGERLLLFIGIIDILQSYRLIKKFEHGLKSIVHDGDSISVHRPSFYAQRFQTFFDREVFKKISSLDAPTVAGPNARFRKIVHTVNFALRSPSKKKANARQRSSTDPNSESSHSISIGGAMLRSKPDLIPLANDHQSSRPTSRHLLDPTFSETTVNTSAYTSSSASTNASVWSGISAPSHGHLSIVRESPRSSETSRTQVHQIPLHDEPLPPYSEKSPVNLEQTSLQSPTENSHASIDPSSPTTPSNVSDAEVSIPVQVITPTAAALVTEFPIESHAQRSSFRRDKSEKPDIPKKGVRFSVSEDTQQENSIPDEESSHSMGDLHSDRLTSNMPTQTDDDIDSMLRRRNASCTAQSEAMSDDLFADEDEAQMEGKDTLVNQEEITVELIADDDMTSH